MINEHGTSDRVMWECRWQHVLCRSIIGFDGPPSQHVVWSTIEVLATLVLIQATYRLPGSTQ